MKKLLINGQAFHTEGNNLSIADNKVYVDGKLVTDLSGIKSNNITVHVYGNVGDLKATGDVSVEGDVGSIETASGDVKVKGSVTGDCKSSSGDIIVGGDVSGSCTSMSGDIKADKINGSCSTMSGKGCQTTVKNFGII